MSDKVVVNDWRDNLFNLDNDDELPKICATCKALSNRVRLDILRLLQNGSHLLTISEIAQALGIPKTTAIHHVEVLEQAELVVVLYKSSSKGTVRVVGRNIKSTHICHFYSDPVEQQNYKTFIQTHKVGHFSDIDCNTYAVVLDDHTIFETTDRFDTKHFDALLLYTEKGILTYEFSGAVAKNHKVHKLWLSLEICSEAPYFNNNYYSDITFWINGVELCTYLSTGDYGDRRGRLNPDWWPNVNTQYGKLVSLVVNDNGVMLNGIEVTQKINVDSLKLNKHDSIKVAFGNKSTSTYIGGMNVFGSRFGDYEQDIILKIDYE